MFKSSSSARGVPIFLLAGWNGAMTIDGNEKVVALVKELNEKSELLCEPNGLEIWLERSTGELVPLESAIHLS